MIVRGDDMKGYQLKITLQHPNITIWRSIQIPREFTFEILHDSIQVLFGWQDCHPYNFKCTKLKSGHTNHIISCDDKLSSHLETGQSFLYTYDYNANWIHKILVEEEVMMDVDYPVLLHWEGENLAENCNDYQHYMQLKKILNDIHHPDYKDTREWMKYQHIPFQEAYVKDELQNIDVYAYDEPILDIDISEQLDTAVTLLRDTLFSFKISDISVVVVHTEEKHKIFAINRLYDSITVQIYDNETDFLIGIDNISQHMVYNLYTNAYNIVMFKDPFPDAEHWSTKDHCCVVKKMRMGHMLMDVNDKEAKEIIQDIHHAMDILTHCTHTTLAGMNEGYLLLGTWDHNEQLSITYPMMQMQGSITTARLHPKQIESMQDVKAYDYNVNIDLLARPAEQSYINHELEICFVLENDTISLCEPILRRYFKTFADLNDIVLSLLCNFIKDVGKMKSITINNDNLHLMLEGICKDLNIPLFTKDFTTKAQEKMNYESFETDAEFIQQLNSITEEDTNMTILNKKGLSEDFYQLEAIIVGIVDKYKKTKEEKNKSCNKRHFDA